MAVSQPDRHLLGRFVWAQQKVLENIGQTTIRPMQDQQTTKKILSALPKAGKLMMSLRVRWQTIYECHRIA